uniref:hypothetical protein n=1 Tax=Bacillus altitudinis TaxID=293387 RepID=UPI001C92F905
DDRGNGGFRELLEGVKERRVGGYAHEDVGFEMVVDELNIVGDGSKERVFEVMFVVEKLGVEGCGMGEGR